jgi:pyrroline-5-carboxylate reductase
MKLGFFGCGNMGEAFLKSICEKNLIPSSNITVCNRESDKNERLVETYEVQSTLDCADLQDSDILFLGFKPQNLEEIKFTPKEGMIVISMLAGKKISAIQKQFLNIKVVRIMPNVGQFVGQGMTGLLFAPQSKFTTEEKALIHSLIQSGGNVLELDNEDQIDAIGTISGSGPAYFFRFAEALAKSAESLGFSSDQSEQLVRQTLIGSAHLLQKNPNDSSSDWREKVTSRGGTTEQALRVFNEEGLDALAQKAVDAAMKRTKELGE